MPKDELTRFLESDRALALRLMFRLRKVTDPRQGWELVGGVSSILAENIFRETLEKIMAQIEALEVEYAKQTTPGTAAAPEGDGGSAA